jgi:hypothetical protein
MGRTIECFKDYVIRNKMDYSGDYEFIQSEEIDPKYIWPSTLLKISDFIDENNIDICWYDIMPWYTDLVNDMLTKDQAEYIKKTLPKPDTCIKILEDNSLIDKIKDKKPKDSDDMILVLERMILYWSQGFYIIETD